MLATKVNKGLIVAGETCNKSVDEGHTVDEETCPVTDCVPLSVWQQFKSSFLSESLDVEIIKDARVVELAVKKDAQVVE